MNVALILVFPVVMISFSAAAMLLMPRLMPATVPLGVRIPASHADDPTVEHAVRRYRMLTGVGWAAGVAASLALVWSLPALSILAGILVFLLLQVAGYVTSRGAIQRAKRDGDWYAGATVRIVADLTPSAVKPPTGWLVAGLAVLAAAAVVGVARYPYLPGTIPIHWNLRGSADGFAIKGFWSVFGQLVVGAAIVVFLYAISFALRRAPVRSSAADSAELNAARAHAMRSLTSELLGQLGLLISLEFAYLSIVPWLFSDASGAVTVGTAVFAVVMVLVIAVFFVRYRSAVRGASGGREDAPADAPDDDRFWKGGLLYVNRDDPSFLVPKRFGVGWTLNLGHPLAVVILVAVLLAIVISIGVSIATGQRLGVHP